MEIFGRKFWKLFGLNLLYSAFFLPLVGAVTVFFMIMSGKISMGLPGVLIIVLLAIAFAMIFGPATAGHTKVLRAYILEKPVFMVHDFIKTFKSEFKYSCIVGIFDCFVMLCIAASLYVYPILIEQSGSKLFYVFFAIALSVGIVVLMMNFYMFLMIIATNLSLKNIMKNSFSLAIIALKKNIITLLVIAVFVGIFLSLFLFANLSVSFIALCFLPFIPASWLGLVICFNSYPIIQKYIINPYYEERGEINPELLGEIEEEHDPESEDVLFEDMGGKEQPLEAKKAPKSKGRKDGGKGNHKGKVIS